ncbi:prolactin-releasing peptide receptor-like [Mya arenaria]|uniref:prolactin-releasing peptide receptor-like n=1 Tax=Mya arenaria TaxID=6604 RepID=UPI0022E41666|nr:prolactin-releasing peptide receptor-like [Mya arenaria]XP_052773383.1 prolactin-releasing peptide receptor-like [Mya arenaria]XP_052773384.1 prolactin-releasing peptide receptor-like [Mya arenaria]XP_052773385.1 prolactin-releasing peptide receptor-like [Mya arenaria]
MNMELSLNESEAPPLQDILKESASLTTVFIVLYVVLFFIGVSGNSLVVYVVMRNKAMQTITNIFITNLAFSDIMMCMLAVPFTPLSYFMNSWVFGEVLCHIVPMSLCICVYVSTLTSTAIAVDRYFVIVYPFKPRMKTCVCLLMIVAIWIISVSISLPLGIYQVIEVDRTESKICKEQWPKDQARQFFTVTSLVLQYIVPCSIITYCYSKVSLALRRRSRSRIGTGSVSRERDEMEIRRKKRTNKMLIAMVTIFVCCWLPLNMVLLVAEYHSPFNYKAYFPLIFLASHVIAMSSIIYNPFLYAWMNDNFKKEFKLVLPCLFRRGNDRNVNGNYTQYTHVETNPSVVMNKSPQKETNGNENVKETKAYFEAETEKVHLNVSDEHDNSD